MKNVVRERDNIWLAAAAAQLLKITTKTPTRTHVLHRSALSEIRSRIQKSSLTNKFAILKHNKSRVSRRI